MELRLRLGARATRDLDAVFFGAFEEWLQALDDVRGLGHRLASLLRHLSGSVRPRSELGHGSHIATLSLGGALHADLVGAPVQRRPSAEGDSAALST